MIIDLSHLLITLRNIQYYEMVRGFGTPAWFWIAVFAVFGSLVGSFLNVCIYRIPREGMNIVFPGSHCTYCLSSIKWYDNIPVISYILLRGKCRQCGIHFSARYMIIEAVTSLFFVFSLIKFHPYTRFDSTVIILSTLVALVYGGFLSALLIATMIDIDKRIIPDSITIGGMVVVPLLALLLPSIGGTGIFFSMPKWMPIFLERFVRSLAGMLTGLALIYGIAKFGKILFGREAMGYGDMKLLGFIGAFTGWTGCFITFFIAVFSGVIIGLPMKFINKTSYIPFGPSIALGGALTAFFKNDIITWYIELQRSISL